MHEGQTSASRPVGVTDVTHPIAPIDSVVWHHLKMFWPTAPPPCWSSYTTDLKCTTDFTVAMEIEKNAFVKR